MGRKSRLKRARRDRGGPVVRLGGPSGALGRIYWGALSGLFFAVFALLAGALRIVVALARGREIAFDDLQFLLYYVGGFILAGVAVGLLFPLARSTWARYGVGILGAGVLTGTFTIGIAGSPAEWDGASWFSWSLSTLFFGILLARMIRDWQIPII